MQKPHVLSCHCGNVQIEIDAELVGLEECNCSTCRRSGFLHWKVPAAALKLLTQKRSLTTYVWREITSGHHFCPICGTAMLRTGYPNEQVSVNARCIENIDVFALDIARYDGRADMPPGPLP